jgi:hypothetical protein
MQFQVFIQTTAEQHFTASVIGMPIALVAEGTTEAEALGRARAMLEELLATGKFVTVDLSSDLAKERQGKKHPWMEFGGMWEGDPDFDEFVAEMKKIREKEDREDHSNTTHAALLGHGMFKDDPTFDDFLERTAEWRVQFDSEA